MKQLTVFAFCCWFLISTCAQDKRDLKAIPAIGDTGWVTTFSGDDWAVILPDNNIDSIVLDAKDSLTIIKGMLRYYQEMMIEKDSMKSKLDSIFLHYYRQRKYS